MPRDLRVKGVFQFDGVQNANDPFGIVWGCLANLEFHLAYSLRTALPDAWNKAFRPCHVGGVFVAELLEHHPLLRTDTKGEENSKSDQVRWTCHPIRDDERVGNAVEQQRR